jgi:UPF0042 nucleotide-binding protein
MRINSVISLNEEHLDLKDAILLVTGISGAGKTEVMKALEDIGFFCIDNLPPSLLKDLVKLPEFSEDADQRVAIAMDMRSQSMFLELFTAIDSLQGSGNKNVILFMDCADDVLVRRYSETRRRHPMRESLNIYESIAIERAALSEVRERANLILDTSHMKSHELKERLGHLILHRDIELDMVVEVMSFGFKNGVPLDADFVFDVRFLANPHYDPALRPQTGLDAPVADYVFAQPEAVQLLDSIASLMERWIPMHAKAGKARLTIGIGCTGGQHRSVAIAKSLADRLDQKFNFVSEVHRDIRPIGSAHN